LINTLNWQKRNTTQQHITKEEVEDVLESCERFLDKVRDIIKTSGKE